MKYKIDVKYTDSDNYRIIYLPDIVDTKITSFLRDELTMIIQDTDKDILLDLKATEFIDSSGVGVIIVVLKKLMESKRKLAITNAEGIVKESLEMSRIFKYVDYID